MADDPDDGGFRGDGLVILVAALLYVAGLVLLVLGVREPDLPGPLSAYGNPEAAWPLWVQGGVAVVGFGIWRWVNRRRNRAFTVVLLALGVTSVLVLGVASYSRCPQADQSQVWGVVSRVLELVLNNYNVDDFAQKSCETGAPPLALQFAHLAQLGVLLVAATSAVRALLRGQFDRLRVRFSRDVFLAVGVDESAASLLPALAVGARGSTRTILTKDPGATWLSPARTAGWKIVTGDAEDPHVLRTLLARRSGRHTLTGLAVLSADSVRTQRLMHAVDSALSRHRGRASVRALLRIDDAWQAEDWRRRYLGQPTRWVVDTISEFEVTARLLALDLGVREVETVVLVGRSGLTFALLAEVAQLSREADLAGDESRLRVVLVDPLAERVRDEHLLSQRGFGMTAQALEVRDADSVEAVLEGLGDAGRTAVVFTGDVETEDQRLASRLGVLNPDVVIYSRRTEVSGLGGTPLLAQVVAYGTTLDAGAGRPIDRWERIARLVHENFVRANPDPSKVSRLAWDGGLPEFYRASTIRQVITTLGAAVQVGRTWSSSTATEEVPLTDEQLDRMAEIEHASWREHQAQQGAHDDSVPWSELGQEGRTKARQGVADALALLSTLGYRSFADPDAQWRTFRREGEVTAVQRTEAWDWLSSGGDQMRGHAGDWEVVDARGSRAVAAEVFPLTHQRIEGDRYLRVGAVEARRAVPGETAVSPEGTATAVPGQWLLRNPISKEEWLVSEAHFRTSYVAEEPAAQ